MMILQVMEGNSNTYLAAKQELTPVIIASKVMINMMNIIAIMMITMMIIIASKVMINMMIMLIIDHDDDYYCFKGDDWYDEHAHHSIDHDGTYFDDYGSQENWDTQEFVIFWF